MPKTTLSISATLLYVDYTLIEVGLSVAETVYKDYTRIGKTTYSPNKYVGNWTSYTGPPEVTHASQSAGCSATASGWRASQLQDHF